MPKTSKLFFLSSNPIRDEAPDHRQAASRRAIDYWNRIDDFHSQPIPALNLWIADAWDTVGEEKLAASAREKAAQREDRTLLDFYVRGEYQRERDDDDEAVASFSRALRIDPGHIWSLLAMAHALTQVGESDIAEAVCTHAIDRYRSSRAAYYNRGVSLYYQQKYDLAVEDFEKIHELNPDDYLGSFWAGMALLDKGDKAAALEKLRKAAEINSGSFWVPLELAEVFIKMYRRDRGEDERKMAIEQLDRCIENCAGVLDHHEFSQRLSTTAHIQRARLHYWGNNLEAAKKDVNRAYEIASNYSQRHAMHEVALFLAADGPTERRDPEKVIPLAEAAVEQWTKGKREPLFTLGIVYYQAGKYEAALETFQVVNELESKEGPRVHFLLAATYWRLDNNDEARRWYERGVHEDVGMFRRLATTLMGMDKAIKVEETQQPEKSE